MARTSIYLRKEALDALTEISEDTRMSKVEILTEFIMALKQVKESLPAHYSLTLGSYPDVKSKPRRVVCLLAPIISGDFDVNSKISDSDADLLVRTDLELKVSKNGKSKKKRMVK